MSIGEHYFKEVVDWFKNAESEPYSRWDAVKMPKNTAEEQNHFNIRFTGEPMS
jgi:hypothetical protein